MGQGCIRKDNEDVLTQPFGCQVTVTEIYPNQLVFFFFKGEFKMNLATISNRAQGQEIQSWLIRDILKIKSWHFFTEAFHCI